jgi:xanthine dehydrogenase accessory factor
MTTDPTDPLESARRWSQRGEKLALATVTATWGSAPRPAGSLMSVRQDGEFAGSVSGGCVETAVISEAQDAIADGKHRNLRFGVSNEDAWAVGLACGGTIEVHVAPVLNAKGRALIETLARARDEKKSGALATKLASGESRFVPAENESGDALGQAVRDAARRDVSRAVAIGEDNWFLTVINPPVDLAIIGAVHIAQPLAAMAKLAGHDVRVIDPRERFASAERFSDVALVHEWPDEALAKTPLGLRSAVVALTHDPKLDDPALQAALKSPAFYIGALGSRQTHARRQQRLKEAGFSNTEIARIKGPIGLDIGARSPAEIAVAILGEVTRELRVPKES